MTREGVWARTRNETDAYEAARQQYNFEMKAVDLKWDPLVYDIIPHGVQTAEQDLIVTFMFKCEDFDRVLCKERWSMNRLAAYQIELERYAAEVGPGWECTHKRKAMLEYLEKCRDLDQFTSKAGHYERVFAIGYVL